MSLMGLIAISGIFGSKNEDLDILPPPPPFPDIGIDKGLKDAAKEARNQGKQSREEYRERKLELERRKSIEENKKEEQRKKQEEMQKKLQEKQKKSFFGRLFGKKTRSLKKNWKSSRKYGLSQVLPQKNFLNLGLQKQKAKFQKNLKKRILMK